MALSERVQNELLEGRVPRDQEERGYMEFYGWTACPMAERPTRMVTCRWCGKEWEATGWPAPKRMTGLIDINATVEITNKFIFLFPEVCSEQCQTFATYGAPKKADDPRPEEEEPERF